MNDFFKSHPSAIPVYLMNNIVLIKKNTSMMKAHGATCYMRRGEVKCVGATTRCNKIIINPVRVEKNCGNWCEACKLEAH